MAIGCNTFGLIAGADDQGFSSGCLSVCSGMVDVKDRACNGIECCQTPIPEMFLSHDAGVGLEALPQLC
ncbi:uncharacterized protein J3R85_003992 [Psidium guajava]|nr:uncharacterized protein J3R85_003992 [Psidium guajava]